MSSQLYLIRHGQASFMQDNYDQLSPLGWEQARILGTYLAQKDLEFDSCWMGSLQRHIDTYEGAQASFLEAQKALPEAIQIENLNEHQGAELHQHILPDYLDKPENAALKEALAQKGTKDPQIKKQLLRLFFQSTKLWALSKIEVAGFESYKAFEQRVREAYQYLLDAMSDRESAIVFSSGGTIAMLMGILFELGPEKIIELNWQVRNGSITEFSYSKGKFYLRAFNQIPHFEDQKLVTYV